MWPTLRPVPWYPPIKTDQRPQPVSWRDFFWQPAKCMSPLWFSTWSYNSAPTTHDEVIEAGFTFAKLGPGTCPDWPQYQIWQGPVPCQEFRSHFSNSFLEMPKVLRLLLTILSGTGSICVWSVIGLFNPGFVHFSCPPLPFVPVLTREQPFSNRKRLKSAKEMLDILTVFIPKQDRNT